MMRSKSNKVIETAHRLFSEKGFDATTMREISREAGLTTGGIYYYVESKEALWNDVEGHVYQELRILFENRRKDPTKREDIKDFINNYCKWVASHKNIATIIMERSISHGEGPYAEECRARRKEFVNHIRDFLQDAVATGETDEEIDTTLAAFSLIAMVVWISLWFNPSRALSIEKVCDMLANIFTDGFFKENPSDDQ